MNKRRYVLHLTDCYNEMFDPQFYDNCGRAFEDFLEQIGKDYIFKAEIAEFDEGDSDYYELVYKFEADGRRWSNDERMKNSLEKKVIQ